MTKRVVWTKKAKHSLDRYCEYIAEEAPEASQKVKKAIVDTAKTLSRHPYLYQMDEYYPDNSGKIRRFFRWNYRVIYLVREEEVVILDVYHTDIYPDYLE